jgi:hypothetical protein
MVQPVRRSSRPLMDFVRVILPLEPSGCQASMATAKLVAAIISYFLGPDAGTPGLFHGAQEPHQFQVSPGMLARPGSRNRFTSKKRAREDPGGPEKLGGPRHDHIKKAWLYSPLQGSQAAMLLLPGSFGTLAHVKAEVLELDLSCVSRSIDSDPFFSRDGPGNDPRCGSTAWHAVKVHNFCRVMGAPDACCERVGSLMESAYSKRTKASVSHLMDEVLLTDAKVLGIGTQRDEAICREVAEAFLYLGKRPTHNAGRLAERRCQDREASGALASRALARRQAQHQTALAESGRRPGGTNLEALSGAPSELLARSEVPHDLRAARKQRGSQGAPKLKPSAAVMEEMRKGACERGVRALPMFLKARGSADREAGSVQRHKLRRCTAGQKLCAPPSYFLSHGPGLLWENDGRGFGEEIVVLYCATASGKGWLESEEGQAWQAEKKRRAQDDWEEPPSTATGCS